MTQTTHEIDFLPAALEIQDRPPSPLGRIMILVIMAFFVIALVWSIIGRVDIVATAQGKIVPSGRTKVIQPKELGVVKAIHVREGQAVKAGDVLIELDPTNTEADASRLASEHASASQELARLQALNKLLADENFSFDSLDLSVFHLDTRHQLQAEWSAYRSRRAALTHTIRSRESELAAVEQDIKKREGTLPLITERAGATRSLVQKSLASNAAWLELEQERIEQQQDLAAFREHKRRLLASIEEAREQRQSANAEYEAEVLGRFTQAKLKLEQLRQELKKAESRNALQRLRAPIDGTVQQLAVHTIGGVVQPAQELMKVVPEDQSLEVEAWIENKDIGFVEEGQAAEIKVQAFPFTKYGVIDAEIIDISNDAVNDDKRGLIYATRALMRKSGIRVGDKLAKMTPGMAVTMEVKTGRRRLIEYLAAPLLRYQQDSMKER